MKAMRHMKSICFVISALLVAAALPAAVHAAAMEDYCVIPSYVRTGANPNIMIMLDNDENNGGPAYTLTNTGDLLDDATGLGTYDPSREYFGIFRSKVWYSYAQNKFYPDSAGVFDGNMLNWALTSGYDMIGSILVGGKSSARVGEKVKSLKGESSETWSKLYLYTGTDGASYACEVLVENGNAVFKENSTYMTDPLLGPRKCGLIIDNGGAARYPATSPLVRPASGSAYTKVASLIPAPGGATMYAATDAPASARPAPRASVVSVVDEFEVMYASSGVRSVPGDSFLAKGMDLVNSMVGRFVDVSAAAPPCTNKSINITNPGTEFDPATIEEAYSFTMTASGGNGNFTWTLYNAPSWVSLNPSTGVLSGTPSITDSGTSTVTIKVVDTCASVNTTWKDATLVTQLPWCSTNPISVISPGGSAFVNAAVDEPYVYTMAATGGDGNYTWTLYNTPSWLGYDPSTGQITGTPDAALTNTVTITVTDTCTPVMTNTVTKTLTSTLPPSLTPVIINSPMNEGDYITQGVQGSIYSGYIAVASGGQTPYTWSATNLATYGLSIDSATGLISGVPTVAAGPYDFTLTVRDFYNQEADRSANIAIINTTPAPSSLAITSVISASQYSDVNVGWYLKAGVPKQYFYSGIREIAQGGSKPYTWSATGLANGLSINPSTGLINGTPLDPSPCLLTLPIGIAYGCPLTVKVTDSLGATASVNRSYDFNYGAINGTSTNSARIINLTPWGWSSGLTLPSGTQGQEYTGWIAIAYGGAYSYVWTATGLPTGLQMESNTGLIHGTPTGAAAVYSPNICLTDDRGASTCSTLTLTIAAAGSPSIVGAPSSWNGYKSTSIVPITFAASGGVGPYTWSATLASGAALPGSLTINSSTGYFSGAVPTTGTYSIKITVKDKYNNVATYTFPLTIVEQPWSGLESWELSIISCPSVDPDGPATSDGIGGYYNDPYTYNCSNFPPDSVLESTHPVRSGLIQEYIAKARFGLMDFSTSSGEVTGNEDCVYQYSKDRPSELSNFFTEVENAVPTSVPTKLANGMYKAVNYFLFNSTDPTTDPTGNPFYDDIGVYARASSTCNGYSKIFDIPCRRNFVLILTGGAGVEEGDKVFPVGSGAPDGDLPADNKCRNIDATFSSKNIVVNACLGANSDVNRITAAATEHVLTYAVNVDPDSEIYFISSTPTSAGILNAASKTYGGGKYYAVRDPSDLKRQLGNAFDDMIKRAASGTAASVLASGEGSGANLIQAVYYPGKEFFNPTTDEDDTVFWLGRLSNFWYYVDPFFKASSIREDTNGDSQLNLDSDYVISLSYDPGDERVEATRMQDTNADGSADVEIDVVPFEEVNALWEAGTLLWERDLTDPATDRKFLVHFSNTTNALDIVNSSNAASVATSVEVQRLLQANDATHAMEILKFTLGYDMTGYRSRTVYLDTDGDGTYEGPHVWKLGDVVDSTPRILSHLAINKFDTVYEDYTYKAFVNDPSYKSRGYVFAGGNDGMLHAFYLGQLTTFDPPVGTSVAILNGTDRGKEVWAFIPRNALPYLNYASDDAYCHVFTIDLSPYLLDASVADTASGTGCTQSEYWKCDRTQDSWRTILIGGMRTGGGCRETSSSCTDCVKTPLEDAGYSSYFALDVTDPLAPELLWEFDGGGQLGMTTSGPTILRVGYKDSDQDGDGKINGKDGDGGLTNGRWFAVFGSGPTGPIDKDSKQFMGNSDQTPKLFVLDLYSGSLLKTLTPATAIPGNGFIGSIIDTSNDSDQDYQDDAFYVGYTYENTDNTFTKGGVGRILTWEDMDPNNWTWTTMIDELGAVTSSIVHLQNNAENKLWIYWASGRFFYKNSSGIDDETTRQALYGVKDPCYTNEDADIPFNEDCNDTDHKLDVSVLEDKTTMCTLTPPDYGWFINLEEGGEKGENVDVYLDDGSVATYDFGAERVITDPLASTIGVVYFTSFRPYSDQCDIGGRSYVWAVDYESGGDASARLKGTALIQVSTGAIEQLDLTSVFGDGACDGTASDTFGIEAGTPPLGPDGQPTGTGDPRKSASVEGVPPVAQGFSLLSQPAPTPRVLHMREQ